MVGTWAAIILATAPAQDVHEYRSSGRASSAENRLAAANLVERLNLDCAVTGASRLGANATGAAHFEVSCSSGPGYLLIDAMPPRAVSCLALAGAARDRRARRQDQCQLPANRIDLSTWRGLASQAGIDCDVDQGAMLGVKAAGGEIHEIGCRDAAGYFIELGEDNVWAVTDCLILQAQGHACGFTSRLR